MMQLVHELLLNRQTIGTKQVLDFVRMVKLAVRGAYATKGSFWVRF
jgi:hypothetical protein